MAARSQHVGGANPEFVLRSFEGVNTINSRDLIGDDEFYWLENIVPVSPGSLYPVNTPSFVLTAGAETGPPSYAAPFTIAGNDHIFAVWSGTGHGYDINISAATATLIISGLTSGQTVATSYNNQGVLILDPTGYWDWNVTTASTLTPQNNAVASFTPVGGTPIGTTVAGGTTLHQVLTTGSGVGGSFQTIYQVTSVTISVAGTGYVVGDVLSFTDGSPTAVAQVTVASIGGGGAITGIAGLIGGAYPGPITGGGGVAVGPGGATISGGSGTGASFAIKIQATGVKIIARGSGYSNSDTLQDATAVPVVINTFDIVTSGVIGGTSIATYAGRVWLASGRVISFTDINSYNSFGGAGGSFTISDSYLHIGITALCAANNYLYIFGDSSVDALSNVTISAGVTSFSRINLTSSIGTIYPTSVFGYYRSVAFFNQSGFYVLSGATPEKISQKINTVVTAINLVSAPPVFGAQATVQGELCACFLFQFADNFTQPLGQRTIVGLFFRGRWWFASTSSTPAAMVGIPNSGGGSLGSKGVWTLYVWEGNQLFQMFSPFSVNTSNWLIKTKLWDAGAAFKEKQAINSAIAGLFTATGATGITIQVDTELGNSTPVATQVAPSVGYDLLVKEANEGGSQFLGLTVVGATNAKLSRLQALALRGKADRDMLT